jgi:WD40 repeat protein
MADLTGQQLNNYRLVRHLGRGGFADVYLGEHLYLRSYAALKLMHIALEGDAARNFLFEAQTLVRLNHRHIVRVLDFRIDRGYPVLIMDYVAGGALRQRHERGACLALDQVVHYVKQIAEALQFAHNQQLIHRDVKPENVLLDTEQNLYLSDFGLALFAPSPADLDTQKLVGTLPYTAPEQWQGHATFASDQYSLAIMAYEWLCGKRPFEGNYIALFSQHMYEAAPPLRDLCPELPEGVEQVILRALAKDPGNRFVSVRAFALALERASREEVTQAGISRVALANALASPSGLEAPVQRKLFIAAASADRAFAERVSADLRQRDIHLAYDARAPLKQEGDLREAVRASYLVMVVASPQMRTSRTIREQLRIALLYRRRLVFVWVRGENIAAALLDLAGRTAPIDVIDARDGRYETALDEIIDCLQEDTNLTPVAVTPLASLNDEPRNPYKGLRAFTKEDASDFFGRDALVQRILGILENMLDPRKPVKANQRLLTVVGPSGSGKSSAIMAGVLPKLQRGALGGSEKWCYVETMVPGQHPCEALLATLVRHFPPQKSGDVRNVLAAEHGYGLYQIADFLSKPTNRRVVLCVDQFEELFAIGVPEGERQHFLKVLLNAVSEPQSPLVVFLTLRADFYDRPMYYRELATLIVANQVSVLPMDNQELRTAIEQPAAQADVQLFFEGDLVGDLLFELQGQGGALPLLGFTLEQLFRQRQGHWLTQEAYRAIGGLRGALARHAEDVYSGLPSDEHRRLARTLFLRLIDPGKSEQDTTRRRAALSELLFVDEEETRLMSEVMHSFISARLLTTTMIVNVTSLEVSHEALIREWSRLASWLHGAREDIVLQHAITADAAIWQKAGQAADRLYRGMELAEAVGWLGRNKGNADEVAFVRAGEAEERRREMEEEVRLKRELGLKRQTVQHLRAFVATLSILLIFSVGFGGLLSIFYNQLQITTQQKILALQTLQVRTLLANANTTASTGNIDTALLLANAAIKKQDRPETRNTMLNILNLNPQLRRIQPGPAVTIRMIALDTKYHEVIYSEGVYIYIDDTNTGTASTAPFPVGKQNQINAIALSPDDNMVAIGNNEGIWLRDMQKQKIMQLNGIPDYSSGIESNKYAALSFSADNKTLLSARCFRYDGTNATNHCLALEIASWTIKNMTASLDIVQNIQLQTAVNPNTFVISGDTKSLAMSNGNETDVWNIASGQALPLTTFTSATNVNHMAFSPDGNTLAVSTEDNTIQIWNRSTGQKVGKELTGHTDAITALAFNPNGQSLAASSLDQSTLLWNVQTGEKQMTFNGDKQQKYGLAFSSDGQSVCTSSYSTNTGDRFLFWDTAKYNAISQTVRSTLPMRSLVFSSDGQKIYVGRGDGNIEILSTQKLAILNLVPTTKYSGNALNKTDNPFSVHSLALNNTGTILAAGRLDGSITVWDVSTQTPKLITALLHPNTFLSQVQLSNDGHMLVSSDTSGVHMLWDLNKSAHPSPIKLPIQDMLAKEAQQTVALSPDGKYVAMWVCSNAACTQDQIKIWDIAKQTFSAQGSPAQTSEQSGFLTFSPDNHTIASIITPTSNNNINKVQLWNSEQAEQTIAPIQIADPNSSINTIYTTLRFSPKGNRLVAYTQTAPFSFVVLDQQDKYSEKFNQFSDPIQLEASNAGDMSFSSDGTQLLSAQVITNGANYEGKLVLWNVSETTWQEQTCQIVHHELSKNDWQHYGDGEPYTHLCS